MLFKPGLIKQIMVGHKTQTRRVLKPGEYHNWDAPYCREFDLDSGILEIYHANKRLKWIVGRDYAVCPGRGQHQVARIVFDNIRQQSLVAITEADAIAEGFEDRDAFIVAWNTINPKTPFESNPAVWVIDFTLKSP